MTTFNIELRFLMPARSQEHSDVMDMLAWMAGSDMPDEPEDYERTDKVNEVMTSEIPFAVVVDGDEWYGVDRTTQDGIMAVITVPQATVPDNRLEDLADVEEMKSAAVWIIENNEWEVEVFGLVAWDVAHRAA